MNTTLSRSQTRELRVLENRIERGLETFIEVGEALVEIRNQELYRATHDTFDAYCRDRWKFTSAHAIELIDAAAIARVFSAEHRPNQPQARALVKLRHKPEQVVMAWQEASADGKPTVAKVRAAVQRRQPRDEAADQRAAERDRRSRIAQVRLELVGIQNALTRTCRFLDPADISDTDRADLVGLFAEVAERATEGAIALEASNVDRQFGQLLDGQ